MAIVTQLLVRYRGGWIIVEDPTAVAVWGPSMQPLVLGDIDDEAEARRIATAHLSTLSTPDQEVSPSLDLFAAQGVTPWDDYELGDYITAPNRHLSPAPHRVTGWTIDEDPDGIITVAPDLNDLIEEAAIATNRWLRRMAPGALGGRTEAASPAAPSDSVITRRALTSQATFSFSGQLDPGEVSSLWRPQDSGRMVGGLATLETRDPSADVVLRLYKQTGSGPSHSSAPVMDIVIPAGQTEQPVFVNEDWSKSEGAKVEIVSAGSDAAGVTVQLWHLRWDS